jgi:hypothetical protein
VATIGRQHAELMPEHLRSKASITPPTLNPPSFDLHQCRRVYFPAMVKHRYDAPFRFTGKIKKVIFKLE